MAGLRTLPAPKDGIWRIGRGADPLKLRRPEPPPRSKRSGNRFDSLLGDYAVGYYSTNLLGCFGETLARLRPANHLLALVQDEWQKMHFVETGGVPADWRHRRSGARAEVPPESVFVDVEALESREFLRRELATGLAAWGFRDLTVADIRADDRRVTRLISQWVHNQQNELGSYVYSGVRYLSKLNTEWECWGVFDWVPVSAAEIFPIAKDMPELEKICELYGLRVF